MASSGGGPLLNCSVSDDRVRVLAAAVAMLARVAESITLDIVDGSSIVLRALSDSQSSYAMVTLERDFFLEFQAAAPAASGGGDDADGGAGPASTAGGASQAAPGASAPQRTSALLSAKALANALRSLRGTGVCQMYFASRDAAHFFVVVLRQRNGVVRTHSLSYSEAEVFAAVFDTEASRNVLIGQPQVLERLVGRIRGTDEASLLASSGIVQLQGFHEAGVETTMRGAVHTSVAIEITAFDKFLISAAPPPPSQGPSQHSQQQQAEPYAAAPSNVTFSVKELKHLLAFAQSSGVASEELAMYFSAPGDPVLFSTRGVIKRAFHASLIVASLEQPVQASPGSPLAAYLARAYSSSQAPRSQR
jgi:cell cycle checkpoint control protein RAD9A